MTSMFYALQVSQRIAGLGNELCLEEETERHDATPEIKVLVKLGRLTVSQSQD